MFPLARIAYRNTKKNWRHSLAAIISISAGFLSLVLFQGYIADVNQMYDVGFSNRAMYGHVIIENPEVNTTLGKSLGEEIYLDVAEQKKIKEFLSSKKENVHVSVRFLPVTGTVTNGINSFIFIAMGYDLTAGAEMRKPLWEWEALYGEPLHVAQNPQGIVLGQALGFLLGCEPNPKILNMVQNDGYEATLRPFKCDNYDLQVTAMTASGQLNALDMSVVGLIDGGYKDIDEKWMKMSIESAQLLTNTDKIKFVTTLLKNEKDSSRFIQDFNEFAKTNNLKSKAVYLKDHPVADLYNKTRELLGIFQIFIVTVTLTISGLSVLNTVVKSVKERTREIGTLRSIGYNRQTVGSIFTFEAFYLSLLGVGIGIGLAGVITFFVNHAKILYRAGLLSEPVYFRITFDFSSYVLCTFLLAGLAVITSFFAVRSTLKKSVAENLANV
ncbi:MAG: ABC transporter permease [Bdellovibrionales bacterium]